MKRTTLMITILAAVFYFGDLTARAEHGHGGGVAGEHGGHGTGKMNKPDSNKGMKPEKGKDASGLKHDKTVSDRLAHNPALSSKLQSLLPANTTLQNASSGFKNMGQFVAAVHVAHNLNIPFNDLKTKVMAGDSLGKAIHELYPNVNAKAETKKAEHQAKKDIKESKVETKEAEKHGDEDKEGSSS